MNAQPTATAEKRAAATYTGLKIFGYVVLLLMAVSIIFSIYIMFANWSHIGV